MTLPDSVLDALSRIDRDVARAIVRLAQPALESRPHPPAELVSFGGRAVIVVNPTRTLEQRTGVLLVPLSDGRALIAFDDTMTANRLELTIQDALEDDSLPPEDAEVFRSIVTILRDSRRTRGVTLRLQNIMVLEFGGMRTRKVHAGRPNGSTTTEDGGHE